MKMRYNLTQVMSVAQFLWNNNPSIGMWPSQPRDSMDIFDQILSMARQQGVLNMADPDNWIGSTGTGGFIILITSDEEDAFDVEVYVDAAIGRDCRVVEEYVDEEDDPLF